MQASSPAPLPLHPLHLYDCLRCPPTHPPACPTQATAPSNTTSLPPTSMLCRPTQMRPFMKVPVVSTTALQAKVIPKNVRTPLICTRTPAGKDRVRLSRRTHRITGHWWEGHTPDHRPPPPPAATVSLASSVSIAVHRGPGSTEAGAGEDSGGCSACRPRRAASPRHWVRCPDQLPCPHGWTGWACLLVAAASPAHTPACPSERAAPTRLDPAASKAGQGAARVGRGSA